MYTINITHILYSTSPNAIGYLSYKWRYDMLQAVGSFPTLFPLTIRKDDVVSFIDFRFVKHANFQNA